jgi:AcrR family transcriptional regulator
MTSDTRRRMTVGALELFRRHGYNGTGLRDVMVQSAAPRGSIYHHFPDGKVQLGVEAVDMAAEVVAEAIEQTLGAADPREGLDSAVTWWTDFFEADRFQAGCPVFAVAAETHPEAPELSEAASRAFSRWETSLADAFRRAGVSEDRAWSLATLVVASIEGAVVMCRATHDRQPLDRVSEEIQAVISAAVADRR